MINIKEIQLGNIVFRLSFSAGDAYHTEANKNVYYIEVSKDVYDMIYKHPDNFFPVELTEKELKRLGFKEDVLKYTDNNGEQVEYVSWISSDGRVVINQQIMNSNNTWFVHVDTPDMDTQNTCELTYLHQLQNFLIIAGIEYEFEM